jgi:stage V sporulation protein R
MEYEHLTKSYTYGLHKIYEMVINNNPSYAYLLENNGPVDQKLVMGHVYAHSDFFKNNLYYSGTDRKMVDRMANHATRARRYVERHGLEAVEAYIDACLSIEDLIDPHAQVIRREEAPHPRPQTGDGEEDEPRRVPVRLKSKSYMESFVNPPEYLEAQQRRIEEDARRSRGFPEHPVRDVLRFLMENAPLEAWQREILTIVHDEAAYFLPQRQTKIMNEGWATYWHSRIMTERALRDSEVVDYADHHAGTVASAPGRLNPYKLGVELFRDIENRWNRGQFGPEYEACEDLVERVGWDKHLGLGRDKIFEVRKLYCDVTFIDTFLTEEFCHRQRLFSFAYDGKKSAWTVQSREFRKVKEALLFQLTNSGSPVITVSEANYSNRGELVVTHQHEGVDLREDWARETLVSLQRIWKRPVHLDTRAEGKPRMVSFDGTEFSEK